MVDKISYNQIEYNSTESFPYRLYVGHEERYWWISVKTWGDVMQFKRAVLAFELLPLLPYAQDVSSLASEHVDELSMLKISMQQVQTLESFVINTTFVQPSIDLLHILADKHFLWATIDMHEYSVRIVRLFDEKDTKYLIVKHADRLGVKLQKIYTLKELCSEDILPMQSMQLLSLFTQSGFQTFCYRLKHLHICIQYSHEKGEVVHASM